MAKTVSQLKKLAKLAGFDADALVGEIAHEVAKTLPPPVDTDQITTDVANRVNAQQSAKLEQILDAVKSNAGEVDTTGIIQGVAKILQPQLMEAIKETSQEVFQSNSRALINQINANLEERLKKNSEPTEIEKAEYSNLMREGNDEPEPRQNGHRTQGLDLFGLLRFAMENSDKIAELANAFKPKVADSEIVAKGFEKAFADYRMIDGFKRRLIDVQATENEIKNLGKA